MSQVLGSAARCFAPHQWWNSWYDGVTHSTQGGILMWVYRELYRDGTDTLYWSVGFYDPAGEWHPDGDYKEKEKAAARCRWLNGGDSA